MDTADATMEDDFDGYNSPDQDGVSPRPTDDQPNAPHPELPTPKWTIEVLNNPPPYLAGMRQALFEVKTQMELKPEEFERYWPFVDNVWTRQHKSGVASSGRSSTDYYACRLQRPTNPPRQRPRPEGKSTRRKKAREGGTCQVRIKAVKSEAGCRSITISRMGEHEHSHDLDAMDKLKRNSVVMDIARTEGMKGFMPASVYTIMTEAMQNLCMIGGKYLSRYDVRNASSVWRQMHTGELTVHPGYRYDHGNGIINNNDGEQTSHLSSTIDPAATSSSSALVLPNAPSAPPAPIAPISTSTPYPPPGVPFGVAPHFPIYPPTTLFFPAAKASFLQPYLPLNVPVPDGGIPHITLTYASSMDSFLSISPTVPTAISGPETKSMTHYLRSKHDAILIGVGTALADNPTLNCRLAGAGGYGGLGWSFHPRPVIIDPGARWNLTPDSPILRAVKEGRGRAPWIIITAGANIDPKRVSFLNSYGGKYVGMPDMDERYRLRWTSIFCALAQEGIKSVMVEGGATVINELMRPDHVDVVNSVIVTVSPTYLGVGGIAVCPNRKFDKNGTPVPAVRFKDVKWQGVGEDVVMCGRTRELGAAIGLPLRAGS